jgi:hypothetical protein
MPDLYLLPGVAYDMEQTTTRSALADQKYAGFTVKMTGLSSSNGQPSTQPTIVQNVVSVVWVDPKSYDWFPYDGKGVQYKRCTSIAFNTPGVSGGPDRPHLCDVNWADWKVYRRTHSNQSGTGAEIGTFWSRNDCISISNSSPRGLFFTKIKTTHPIGSIDYATEIVGVEIRSLLQ